MRVLPMVVLIILLAVGVDRLLLWCELHGWIYYRRMPRIRHGAGNALLNIEALLQPSWQHVIDLRQDAELHREEDDEGAEQIRKKAVPPD